MDQTELLANYSQVSNNRWEGRGSFLEVNNQGGEGVEKIFYRCWFYREQHALCKLKLFSQQNKNSMSTFEYLMSENWHTLQKSISASASLSCGRRF